MVQNFSCRWIQRLLTTTDWLVSTESNGFLELKSLFYLTLSYKGLIHWMISLRPESGEVNDREGGPCHALLPY